VKLLFYENLSPSLPRHLAKLFPESVHVRDIDLAKADDDRIWEFASVHGFVIISKDDDFRQRAILQGPPPKVVGLLLGNCTVEETVTVLRNHAQFLHAFATEPDTAYFALQRSSET